MFNQRKIAMLLAEFFGTAMLALAFYTIVARTSFPLFTGLAAGITVGLVVLTLGRVSGAHINPAVTLSAWTMRKVNTLKAISFIAAQMLGGLAAWGLIGYLSNQSVNSIAGGEFSWRVFIAEAIGSGVLLFGVVASTASKLSAPLCAVVTGGLYLVGILIASLASNATLNPAVAVGVQSWNWTYAVAPLVGGVVGANVYAMLFAENSSSNKSSNKKK